LGKSEGKRYLEDLDLDGKITLNNRTTADPSDNDKETWRALMNTGMNL
jgi:hypothetical protein